MGLKENLELWLGIAFVLSAIARFVYKAHKTKWHKVKDVLTEDLFLHYLVLFAMAAFAFYFT